MLIGNLIACKLYFGIQANRKLNIMLASIFKKKGFKIKPFHC